MASEVAADRPAGPVARLAALGVRLIPSPAMADKALEEAWNAVHKALLRNWYVGRPTFVERLNQWKQVAFDPSERPKVEALAGVDSDRQNRAGVCPADGAVPGGDRRGSLAQLTHRFPSAGHQWTPDQHDPRSSPSPDVSHFPLLASVETQTRPAGVFLVGRSRRCAGWSRSRWP
jgi:hypothetical protein